MIPSWLPIAIPSHLRQDIISSFFSLRFFLSAFLSFSRSPAIKVSETRSFCASPPGSNPSIHPAILPAAKWIVSETPRHEIERLLQVWAQSRNPCIGCIGCSGRPRVTRHVPNSMPESCRPGERMVRLLVPETLAQSLSHKNCIHEFHLWQLSPGDYISEAATGSRGRSGQTGVPGQWRFRAWRPRNHERVIRIAEFFMHP